MKNIKIKFAVFFSAIVFLGMGTTAHATLSLTADVDVPASCSATDTDGVVHDYNSPDSYLAICALEAAIQNGSVSSAQLSNQFPSLGLFVTGINDVAADSNSQYWALYQNGGFANAGLTSLQVAVGDVIMLQLHDFSDTNLGDEVTLNVHTLVAPPVPITLSSIAITTPATKLNYTVGDTLDISDLVVTGTYSDNSTKTETITTANISGFDSSAPATDQVLTITDGVQTTTYTVTINAAPVHLSLTADVDVPASCSATDTDGVVHDYNSPDSYLAICALEAAIQNGSVSSAQLSNQFPSLGLFVTGINDVAADSNSQYWALYQNGSFASLGMTSLSVTLGDVIMLQLHDFSDTNLGDEVTLNVHALVSNTANNNSGGNGGGGGASITPIFSVPNAINYLGSVQAPDGSFGGSSLYSDWAGIAIGVAGTTGAMRTNLLSYMASHNVPSSLLADNERRAMALLSLGQNPYAFNSTNYITSIVSKFDGTQLGDIHLDNDDIFGLIVLPKVGYTVNDEIVSKTISFVLSAQVTNGSWDNSPDMTAAAIQALSPFTSVTGVSTALSKATDYMTSTQESVGGWGNVFSTSWAMQAEKALGASWASGGKTTGNYLGAQQATDGAALPSSDTLENRIWATSYAISAALDKPWSEIMQSVLKPTHQNSSGDTTNNSVTTDVKKPTDPVFCPPGDLFSTTTGEACTAIRLPDPVTAPQEPTKTTKKPVKNVSALTKKKPSAQKEDSPNPPAISVAPDALTATAVNALPPVNNSQNIPIILGTVSGFILLYAAIKFWFLK